MGVDAVSRLWYNRGTMDGTTTLGGSIREGRALDIRRDPGQSPSPSFVDWVLGMVAAFQGERRPSAERVTREVYIPLSVAFLCVNCDTVFHSEARRCPCCCSTGGAVSLLRALNGPKEAGE